MDWGRLWRQRSPLEPWKFLTVRCSDLRPKSALSGPTGVFGQVSTKAHRKEDAALALYGSYVDHGKPDYRDRRNDNEDKLEQELLSGHAQTLAIVERQKRMSQARWKRKKEIGPHNEVAHA